MRRGGPAATTLGGATLTLCCTRRSPRRARSLRSSGTSWRRKASPTHPAGRTNGTSCARPSAPPTSSTLRASRASASTSTCSRPSPATCIRRPPGAPRPRSARVLRRRGGMLRSLSCYCHGLRSFLKFLLWFLFVRRILLLSLAFAAPFPSLVCRRAFGFRILGRAPVRQTGWRAGRGRRAARAGTLWARLHARSRA